MLKLSRAIQRTTGELTGLLADILVSYFCQPEPSSLYANQQLAVQYSEDEAY